MSSDTTPSRKSGRAKKQKGGRLSNQSSNSLHPVQHAPSETPRTSDGATTNMDARSKPSGHNETHKTKRNNAMRKPRRRKSNQARCERLDPHLARIRLQFETKRHRPSKKERRHRHRHPLVRRHRESSFLALPAEVRNHIYSYVVPSARILIHGTAPNRELALLKKAWENEGQYVKRPRYRLGHFLANDDIEDDLIVSPSLLLVCRKVNKEVELFMYSRLTFCFDSMNVVHKFLNVASKQGIGEIRSLKLSHPGHGQPKYTCDLGWKEKYDRRWRETCERIAEEMMSLKSLTLQTSIHDWPVTCTEKDRWFNTTMALLPRGPLDCVEVRLRHPRVSSVKMSEVSRKLEDCMMSEQGKRTRDEKEANLAIKRYYEAEADRRARMALLPPVQAKRILSIVHQPTTLDDSTTTSQRPAKKYYTSRTKDYAKDHDAVFRGNCW